MRIRSSVPLVALVLLSGCTVGPNYGGPPKSVDVPQNFARRGDVATAPQAPLARWWEALGDPVLDDLEARALAANPDVAAASARLRQSRAALRLERANQAPTASASAIYAHAHFPGVDLNSSNNDDSSS